MKIQLVALGELSLLTGGVMVPQGHTLEVSKAKAAEAVSSGRWKVVSEPTEGKGAEGKENAGEGDQS